MFTFDATVPSLKTDLSNSGVSMCSDNKDIDLLQNTAWQLTEALLLGRETLSYGFPSQFYNFRCLFASCLHNDIEDEGFKCMQCNNRCCSYVILNTNIYFTFTCYVNGKCINN